MISSTSNFFRGVLHYQKINISARNMSKDTIFVCTISFSVVFTRRRMLKLAMFSIFAFSLQIMFADSENFFVFISFFTLLVMNIRAFFFGALSLHKKFANVQQFFIFILFIRVIIQKYLIVTLISKERASALFPNLFRRFCKEDCFTQLKHHLIKLIEPILLCLRSSGFKMDISTKNFFEMMEQLAVRKMCRCHTQPTILEGTHVLFDNKHRQRFFQYSRRTSLANYGPQLSVSVIFQRSINYASVPYSSKDHELIVPQSFQLRILLSWGVHFIVQDILQNIQFDDSFKTKIKEIIFSKKASLKRVSLYLFYNFVVNIQYNHF